MEKVQAILSNRVQLNETYFELTFTLPNPVDFLPGQFLNFKIGDQFRAYSIASLPDKTNTVSIVVDTKPSGIGSQFAKEAPLGTSVFMLYPLGKFTLVENTLPTVFIATGSGFSPFYPMINQLLENHPDLSVTLLWGMRKTTDLFYQEKWQALQNKYATLKVIYCLSQESQQTENIFTGRVTDYLAKFPCQRATAAYLCGSNAMVEEVTQKLLSQCVEAETIYHEKYY